MEKKYFHFQKFNSVDIWNLKYGNILKYLLIVGKYVHIIIQKTSHGLKYEKIV